MVRDGEGYRAPRQVFLHDDVASASSDFHEAVPSHNPTNLLT
jgi:hypothetical protein